MSNRMKTFTAIFYQRNLVGFPCDAFFTPHQEEYHFQKY